MGVTTKVQLESEVRLTLTLFELTTRRQVPAVVEDRQFLMLKSFAAEYLVNAVWFLPKLALKAEQGMFLLEP